jgi:hypothetical protein
VLQGHLQVLADSPSFLPLRVLKALRCMPVSCQITPSGGKP